MGGFIRRHRYSVLLIRSYYLEEERDRDAVWKVPCQQADPVFTCKGTAILSRALWQHKAGSPGAEEKNDDLSSCPWSLKALNITASRRTWSFWEFMIIPLLTQSGCRPWGCHSANCSFGKEIPHQSEEVNSKLLQTTPGHLHHIKPGQGSQHLSLDKCPAPQTQS